MTSDRLNGMKMLMTKNYVQMSELLVGRGLVVLCCGVVQQISVLLVSEIDDDINHLSPRVKVRLRYQRKVIE